MLTSNSQYEYLHPDYLQPLPTTLDAKKSPLALLAQTCSSIGKDPTPSKPIIPSLGKKDNEKSRDKSESPETKRPESNSSKGTGRDSVDKPGFRTIPSKDIPPLVPISASSDKAKSPSVSRESKSNENVSTSVVSSRPGSLPASLTSSTTTSVVSSTRTSTSSHKETDSRENLTTSASAPKPGSRPSPDHVSYKPSSHPSAASYGGYPPFGPTYPGYQLMSPHGLPVDSAASAMGYPSSLTAHGYAAAANAAAVAAAQSAASLKHASAASAMSPYVTYARVRTPAGATTLVPVCRDPYCSNCQLTLQTSHLSSTCNAPGCSQCAHEKSLQSLSGLGALGGLPPSASLSVLPGFSAASALSSSAAGLTSFPSISSLYPHSAMSAHQGLPFVCNWVSAGNEYCGKRYGTSEELLQHLRTHTTATDTSSLAAAYGSLSGLGGLTGLHGHLTAPGSISPNSLRRSYPTSLSPVSGLLGASRYHPYKSHIPGAPGALPPGQPLPSLGPYYSPYALYGQRLGAAAVP
ncbi:zinc finger protein Noc-like [Ylistrum balloti]|uniref:zinc finger protein Noc-like n=1 Tax=Ylistrum balloti TaxID=509963 RepID=UPI00290587D9|nr:zinc finger protein Noc-like [Ylistrum balloti]